MYMPTVESPHPVHAYDGLWLNVCRGVGGGYLNMNSNETTNIMICMRLIKLHIFGPTILHERLKIDPHMQ